MIMSCSHRKTALSAVLVAGSLAAVLTLISGCYYSSRRGNAFHFAIDQVTVKTEEYEIYYTFETAPLTFDLSKSINQYPLG